MAAKSASALDRARAVLRAEDPTDTDRFFVASPAERCQMLIRRKDAQASRGKARRWFFLMDI